MTLETNRKIILLNVISSFVVGHHDSYVSGMFAAVHRSRHYRELFLEKCVLMGGPTLRFSVTMTIKLAEEAQSIPAQQFSRTLYVELEIGVLPAWCTLVAEKLAAVRKLQFSLVARWLMSKRSRVVI